MQAGQRTKYGAVAMAMHWVIAALMIFMIIFGEDLIRVRSGADAASVTAGGFFLPSIHVSIGVSILVLTVFRLVWRLANPPPPFSGTMKSWENLASKTAHGLFYLLLIGLPMTGWFSFGSYIVQRPVVGGAQVFGIVGLPVAPDLGEVPSDLHGLGSNAAMVLVILHVLAALKHHFIDRDDILRRMLPHI